MEMMSAWRALGALLLCIALIVTGTVAGAQSSDQTGIIQIKVVDAEKQAVLENARVFLLGPSVASALTNRSGIVKYTDVPSGLYRVRISKPGFRTNTSAQFEVLGNKEVDVDVSMAASTTVSNAGASGNEGGLQVIGRVQARVSIATHDVDENSAVRRISDSLLDALNTVAGVDVTQSSNDPDSPQTISLRGHDESQTAVTLDGIPLSAPGTAANLRGINTDLFSGASASFGARAGALGGGVNFSTLQPTQTWQEQFKITDGSFDKYTWSFGETGSIGKLGIALLTTKRGGNNPLTFQQYLDQSGQTYSHGGESTAAGDLIKLRYTLGDTTTLTFTGIENNGAIVPLCTQFTGPLPCGIGPGNGITTKYQFAYGTIQSLVGQVAVQLTGYTSASFGLTSDINRTIDQCIGAVVACPVAAPFSSQNTSLTRGLAGSGTISLGRHTVTLNATTFGATTTSVPLVQSGTSVLVTPSSNGVSAHTFQLSDSLKVNNALSLGPTASLAATTGAGTSVLAGLSGTWRPNTNDAFTFSAQVGSSQPASGIVRSYSDPQSARVNCFAGTAQISGPGDLPTAQSAVDYQLGWTHQWSHGQFSVDAYRQSQAGQLVNATITSAAAGLPADLQTAIQQYYSTVCPLFAAPTIYVSQPVNGTNRIYQGFDVQARIGLGRAVTAITSYSSNAAFYIAADPRFTGTGSTLILGQQIFGRPVHKANLTFDVFHPPSKFEFLLNAQYVGINNQQNLAPYVNFSGGITHPLGNGMLTIFETNIFNTQSGLFSTIGGIPQPLAGGGFLQTVARPLAPRTLQVSFAVNTGARPGAGFARGARSTRAQASPAPNAPRAAAFGFGWLNFIAPPPGTDPLALATSRSECTADLQPVARKVLAQLGEAGRAYAAGAATLPPVDGVTVAPHGAATENWYFGLGPDIPRSLFRRPPGAAGAPGAGPRRPGPGGPGGPDGPPPVGFQPNVSVGPGPAAQQPRSQQTPSPELLAALQPFRALVSCSYGTVLTVDEARARGFDVPVPGTRPSPAPSGSPGPRPGGFIDYAPNPGIFVARPPDLGTGGGSLAQPRPRPSP
jgi:hypothetical protein